MGLVPCAPPTMATRPTTSSNAPAQLARLGLRHENYLTKISEDGLHHLHLALRARNDSLLQTDRHRLPSNLKRFITEWERSTANGATSLAEIQNDILANTEIQSAALSRQQAQLRIQYPKMYTSLPQPPQPDNHLDEPQLDTLDLLALKFRQYVSTHFPGQRIRETRLCALLPITTPDIGSIRNLLRTRSKRNPKLMQPYPTRIDNRATEPHLIPPMPTPLANLLLKYLRGKSLPINSQELTAALNTT